MRAKDSLQSSMRPSSGRAVDAREVALEERPVPALRDAQRLLDLAAAADVGDGADAAGGPRPLGRQEGPRVVPVQRAAVPRLDAVLLEERLAGLEVVRGVGRDAPAVLRVDHLLPRVDRPRKLVRRAAEDAVDVAEPGDAPARAVALVHEVGRLQGGAAEDVLGFAQRGGLGGRRGVGRGGGRTA